MMALDRIDWPMKLQSTAKTPDSGLLSVHCPHGELGAGGSKPYIRTIKNT
jgi:hypothetical protein